ncbi:MAG: carbonate dehydratase [Thermonemataceae bacterium]|nr:carbonate dehydratase [Thermonemataceae bacterium]
MAVDLNIYQQMLQNNETWVAEKLEKDAGYFNKLAEGQSPKFLWIGCSDSRVPAEEITGANPGEVFVHRNIANLVVHTDLNFLSVLQYAVQVLHVQHIIVCGHYGCGGVISAMKNTDYGLVNKWLWNIKEVYYKYHQELDKIVDEKQRANRLVELNVKEQVYNLAETSFVQQAWLKRELSIHGWVFDLGTGKIKDLDVIIDEAKVLHPIFQYNLDKK